MQPRCHKMLINGQARILQSVDDEGKCSTSMSAVEAGHSRWTSGELSEAPLDIPGTESSCAEPHLELLYQSCDFQAKTAANIAKSRLCFWNLSSLLALWYLAGTDSFIGTRNEKDDSCVLGRLLDHDPVSSSIKTFRVRGRRSKS